MIKLQVAEYCQNCPNFVADDEKFYMDGQPVTFVVCTNRRECGHIKQYLDNLSKEQMASAQYTAENSLRPAKR